MQYELKPTLKTTKTTNRKEPESLNFKDILLTKRKKKKPSLLASSKAIPKKYKKIRQKKNDELNIIKQVVMYPRHRLAGKIKTLTDDNDVEIIKEVPLHLGERLKCLTRDMYDDMKTVN